MFFLLVELLICAAGIAVLVLHPDAAWVERYFSNGYYPGWERGWYAFTPQIPFSVGDAVVIAGVVAIVGSLALRRRRGIIDACAIAAVYLVWFYAGWGWGYARPPLTVRVAYDPQRITTARIAALRGRAIAELNALAPAAHARRRFSVIDLQRAWLPVVQRLGDRWTPRVSAAKPTLGGWVMDRNGTSGFINPWTLETQLAPDLLWFERPFDQAHEWSHAAGFNREDEANYIAVIAALRDVDPVARYSGWMELFLYLPQPRHYARATFSPLVWQDFTAIRARNARFVNLDFSRFSWGVYNSYLKSNRIAGGIANYDEVTRLAVAIPLDAGGLPRTRADMKRP